jgi:hypothetical protein
MAKIQRWYIGFSYKGNPKQLIEQISQQIQQQNISQYVPLLRLEKGANSRKTFYFFLAIESSALGEIPPEIVNSNLLKFPYFKILAVRGCKGFTYEKIKSMVGVAHDVEDYTNPIPYQPVEKVTYDNPFDATFSSPINQSSLDIDAIDHRYEQLIYWLSALGYGTWESFKKACDALKLQEPKRILRRLRLLGHIEYSSDGARWSIAPTTLVEVKPQSNSLEFILCGQRSLNLISKLKQHSQVKVINQPRGEAPPCIRAIATNSEQINSLIKQIDCLFPIVNVGEVSLQLANLLPNLEFWKHNLRSWQGIVPSLYDWEYFNCNINNFVSCFSPIETGMYQMQSQKMTGYKYTLFYDQKSDRHLQGDWYGLRFLALQHSGFECVARYDRTNWRLAIPVSQRWPEIYERALVLASGQLPTYQNSWLLYEKVPMAVISLLTDKLNVKCEEEPASA